jgi:hypothetical protein
VGKELADKGDGLLGMVYTDAEFAAACTAHDARFDLFGAKVVEGLTLTVL